MILIHSKIDQGMRLDFEKLVNWHGKNELIPVYLENNICNFYLNREVKSTETSNVNDADHVLRSILHFISCWFHERSWFSQNHLEMP